MRLHDDLRRLVLAGDDAQVAVGQQRADVVRRVAHGAVGHEVLAVVSVVQRVQQRGAGGLRAAVPRQQASAPQHAARHAHAQRHPLVGAPAAVPQRRRRFRRQVQHAYHRLRHGAHEPLAHAGQEAPQPLRRGALVAVLYQRRHATWRAHRLATLLACYITESSRTNLTQYAEPQTAEAGGEVRAGRGGADAAPCLLMCLVAHHALQPVAQGFCMQTKLSNTSTQLTFALRVRKIATCRSFNMTTKIFCYHL